MAEADAATYDFPPVPLVVFLFNPFGADTLSVVAANLARSLTEEPRHVVVAYFNPVHRAVLEDTAGLSLRATSRDWVILQSRQPGAGRQAVPRHGT